jgi:hypothetical protein
VHKSHTNKTLSPEESPGGIPSHAGLAKTIMQQPFPPSSWHGVAPSMASFPQPIPWQGAAPSMGVFPQPFPWYADPRMLASPQPFMWQNPNMAAFPQQSSVETAEPETPEQYLLQKRQELAAEYLRIKKEELANRQAPINPWGVEASSRKSKWAQLQTSPPKPITASGGWTSGETSPSPRKLQGLFPSRHASTLQGVNPFGTADASKKRTVVAKSTRTVRT